MTRSRFVPFLLLLILTSLAACDDEDGMISTPAPIFVAGLDLRSAGGNSASVFGVGEPIMLVLPATNVTNQPQNMNLPTTQVYDFVVTDIFGKLVWRWSTGQNFPAQTTVVDFMPGEIKSFTETWPQVDGAGQQVPAGEYLVQGATDLGSVPETRSPVGAFTIR